MRVKRSWLTLVLLIFIFGASVLMAVESQPATKIYVDPSSILDETKVAGTTFTVDIDVADVPADPGCIAYEFRLNWTGSMMNCTGVTTGPWLQNGGSIYFVAKYYNEEGDTAGVKNYVYVSCTGMYPFTPQSGSGILATITFEVEAYGSSDLNLHSSALLDPFYKPIDNDEEDGYFRNKYPGDIDGDYYVGSADAAVLDGKYGISIGQPGYDIEADFDVDGYIGSADAAVLDGKYGMTFP